MSVKKYKFKLCKVSRQYIETATYTKNYWYNICTHREENCQHIVKKYYTICIIKKGKCADSKELSHKYIINSNFFFLIISYHLLIDLIKLLYLLFTFSGARFYV